MNPQRALILWQSAQGCLWTGADKGRSILVLDQNCSLEHGPLLRERVRLFSGLLHPGFVRVLAGGWGDSAGSARLLMESVPGVPVGIMPGDWGWSGVAQVLEQLALTVAAAHEQGLAFGNLGPGTVLLSRKGSLRALVVGFGATGTRAQDLAGLAHVARDLAQGGERNPALERLLSALDCASVSARQCARLCAELHGRAPAGQIAMAPRATPAPTPMTVPTVAPAQL